MRTLVVLLFLLLPSPACDNRSPSAPDASELTFETIVQASYSGFSESRKRAVRGQDDWTRVWQTLYAGQTPVPALPAVNFDRETVILAAAGARSNGCYSIEITRAGLAGNRAVEFEVTETVPGPACSCTEAVTAPVHLVRIPVVSRAESFVDRRVELSC